MQLVQERNAVSLEAILAVLETLAQRRPSLTVAGIASVLGIRSADVSRLVVLLEGRGLLERDERGGYALTAEGMELTQYLGNLVHVVADARPFLRELASRHGEAVCLSVLRDDEVIVLDVAEEHLRAGRPVLVGKRFPSLATTAGKAIRAIQSRDLLEKVFRRKGEWMRRSEKERLFEELDAIRQRGVAVDVGSLEAGMGSAAAAVRDYAGAVVCALTVVGPSFRMVADRIENEIVPSLTAAAELLSMKYGYAKLSAGGNATPCPRAG